MQKPDTKAESARADEQYQRHVLQGVSRTFALTIPQLPPGLRRVVGNAYLLCRIADTIEDEPALSAEQKRRFSQQFIDAVDAKLSAERFASELSLLLTESTLPAERELIENTPRVLRLTHSFTANQRDILARAVAIMAKGMSVFQANKDIDGLKDLPQLDSYCYYVAGVVGEMLTELFCDYSCEIDRNRDAMMKLAVSFGQGLQMTNILKDIWEDRMRGACWLPQDVFKQARFDLKDLSKDEHGESFEEGLEQLIGIARTHLENALSYTLMIPRSEKGIRRFCLWALGMAVLTLRKINRNRDFTTGNEVKISRRSVRATIAATNMLVSNDRLLKLLFDVTTHGLPPSSPRPIPESRRFRPYSIN
ncbi:MAG: phytoene/squalene synthase family protein [Acidiferrobacterales bacterium]